MFSILAYSIGPRGESMQSRSMTDVNPKSTICVLTRRLLATDLDGRTHKASIDRTSLVAE